MTRIFVPLAAAPFRRFEAGTKTVEVRSLHSPVGRAVVKLAEAMEATGTPVLLRLGYSGHAELHRRLGRVWVASHLQALPADALAGADLQPGWSGFFDPLEPIVAFEVVQSPVEPRGPNGGSDDQ